MLRPSWRSVTEGVCGTDLGSARHHAFKPERITVIDAPAVDRSAESRSDELFSDRFKARGRRNKKDRGESSWHATGTCARPFAVGGRRLRVERDPWHPDMPAIAARIVGRPARETGAWADSRCLHRWNIGPRQHSASAGSQSSGFIGSAVVLAVRRAWCGNV
jgi:hypothetical protein